MILIFKDQALLDEVGYSPSIEGGIGAVKMGTPVKAVDGRVAVCHNFSEVDGDWFDGYTAGMSPGIIVLEDVMVEEQVTHPDGSKTVRQIFTPAKLPSDFVIEQPEV